MKKGEDKNLIPSHNKIFRKKQMNLEVVKNSILTLNALNLERPKMFSD
jgi:hypothetical protein